MLFYELNLKKDFDCDFYDLISILGNGIDRIRSNDHSDIERYQAASCFAQCHLRKISF
jgi:hypothetical protein